MPGSSLNQPVCLMAMIAVLCLSPAVPSNAQESSGTPANAHQPPGSETRTTNDVTVRNNAQESGGATVIAHQSPDVETPATNDVVKLLAFIVIIIFTFAAGLLWWKKSRQKHEQRRIDYEQLSSEIKNALDSVFQKIESNTSREPLTTDQIVRALDSRFQRIERNVSHESLTLALDRNAKTILKQIEQVIEQKWNANTTAMPKTASSSPFFADAASSSLGGSGQVGISPVEKEAPNSLLQRVQDSLDHLHAKIDENRASALKLKDMEETLTEERHRRHELEQKHRRIEERSRLESEAEKQRARDENSSLRSEHDKLVSQLNQTNKTNTDLHQRISTLEQNITQEKQSREAAEATNATLQAKYNSDTERLRSSRDSLRGLWNGLWLNAFGEEGELREWRKRLESTTPQGALVLNCVHRCKILLQTDDDKLLAKALHDLGESLYQLFYSSGFDETKVAEHAERWARSITAECGGRMHLQIVRVGDAKNINVMSAPPDPAPVKHVLGWCVNNSKHQALLKAKVS